MLLVGTVGARVRPGRVPSFPDSLSGLVAWYDMSTLEGFLTGDPVSTVPDLTINGNHLNQTGTNRPTYIAAAQNGLGGIQLDAANDQFFKSAVPAISKNTFIVCNLSSTQPNSLPGLFTVYLESDTVLALGGGGTWYNVPGQITRINSLTTTNYITDTTYSQEVISPVDRNGEILIGSERQISGRYLQGKVFEVLVLNRVLDSTERANMLVYLQNKWNF